MFYALRSLTLIAFAAHAVLGCCLSHGDCGREQHDMPAVHCCGHHHDIRPGDLHSDPTQHQGEGDHSPNRCEDTQCVFDSADSVAPSPSAASSGEIVWVGSLMDQRHQPLVDGNGLDSSPDDFPPLHRHRAFIQIWLL